ncbi:MAG TPA: hypothetical protein VF734_14705, partial [Pseudonocardiaceae bacterium]
TWLGSRAGSGYRRRQLECGRTNRQVGVDAGTNNLEATLRAGATQLEDLAGKLREELATYLQVDELNIPTRFRPIGPHGESKPDPASEESTRCCSHGSPDMRVADPAAGKRLRPRFACNAIGRPFRHGALRVDKHHE